MKIHLSLIRCRYCEYENPADAKFCGACGGELHLPPHLTSCLSCGSVNSASATVCIWCHRPMQERKAGALVPVSPPAEARRTSRMIAAAGVLAALGALGYYGYREASSVDEPRPAAASTETAATTNSTKADDDTGPAPLVTPARAAPNPPRAARQPVESQEGKAAPAIARSQTVGAGRLGEGPSRQEACTEALAALGLCATKPEAGKAGGQEPSRAVECTAATAALGLCPPGTIQRRE